MNTLANLIPHGLICCSIAGIIYTCTASEPWQERQQVQRGLQHIQQENSHLARTVRELRSHIQALKQRPAVQEHVIRDELGYIHSGDVILELRPRSTATP